MKKKKYEKYMELKYLKKKWEMVKNNHEKFLSDFYFS